jgi:cysteine desulfurase
VRLFPVVIDCDANATYAPDERIRGVITSCLLDLGNPSSLHRGGQRAKAVIEESRASVRELVGAHTADTVIFTSGATEANNTILATFGKLGTTISSRIEHPCVLGPLKRLEAAGHKVICVSPDAHGAITPESVAAVVTADTRLVSIMAANNEVGVINQLRDIALVVRAVAPHAVIHSDAAQLLGKGAVNMYDMDVDVLTLSAHKIGALSGTGAIVARQGIEIEPLIVGGPQEGKLRGGTENVLGVAVFGAVARMIVEDISHRCEAMSRVRDAFELLIKKEISGAEINGAEATRLPNTSSVYLPGVRADDLIVAMDLERILISSGAACSSGKPEPSHVLLAMGQDEERVRSTIRVSFRADMPEAEVPRIVRALSGAVERMRKVAPKR